MHLEFLRGITRWVLTALMLGAVLAHAQLPANDPEWKETEAPPPPAFDLQRLISFEVRAGSSLVFGIDPTTIQVSKQDGIVRYVVVARSDSGVVNAMYEGVRCTTAEFKTYARAFGDGKWTAVENAEWISLRAKLPSMHTARLARQGVCDGAAPMGSAREIVQALKK
jgi:CNP1-like family